MTIGTSDLGGTIKALGLTLHLFERRGCGREFDADQSVSYNRAREGLHAGRVITASFSTGVDSSDQAA